MESLHRLHSLVQVLKSRGQSVEPAESVERLKWVDTLQRLGVDRYVQPEIDALLRNVYRSWQQKEEGIFGDPGCLAMAFRILRMKGYNVKP
ncbi:kaurene synthase, partial [Genlisea aurea]